MRWPTFQEIIECGFLLLLFAAWDIRRTLINILAELKAMRNMSGGK
jgi:hypothetical protein